MTKKQLQAQRTREMASIYAVMIAVILLILLQFLLLMVALEGYAAGHWGILGPAAGGSFACFAGSCWLVRYVGAPARGGR